MFRQKKILWVLVFLMVVVFLVAAFEVAGGGQEVHHCVNCCVSHHVAVTVNQAGFPPVSLSATPLAMKTALFPTQPFVQRLDPPPELLP